MIANVLSIVSNLALQIIGRIGYLGVFLLMALESVNIPIPSEVIMPFAGFLVSQNHLNLFLLILIGSIGNLFGSLISYGLAVIVGDPLLRFLKRIPFFEEDYLKAERFFKKHGSASVFFGRMIPIIRTFISFPAGFFRLPIWKFSVLTFVGSFIWSSLMALIGFYLGEKWSVLQVYFHRFDYIFAVIFILLIGWYIIRKIQNFQKSKNNF